MPRRPGTLLAMGLLLAVAVAHLLRMIFAVPITAGGWSVPQWLSALGVLLPVLAAGLLWLEYKDRDGR